MQYKSSNETMNTPYTSLSNQFSLFDDSQIKRTRKTLFIILSVRPLS